MIANGDRTRKLLLDNPGGSVPDGDGGYIEGWVPLAPPTMWARVNPATQADLERYAAGTVLSSQTFLIEMPYHREVSVLTRIQMPDPDRGLRTFQVKSVRNLDEARRELVIVAEEIIGSAATP
jgi:head-tail adaptor